MRTILEDLRKGGRVDRALEALGVETRDLVTRALGHFSTDGDEPDGSDTKRYRGGRDR